MGQSKSNPRPLKTHRVRKRTWWIRLWDGTAFGDGQSQEDGRAL